MNRNSSGYAIPITIGVAVVAIIGGSMAGWGKIRSEIQESIENQLKAKTAEDQAAGYDDTGVLARLAEIERTHAMATADLADLKNNFERLSVRDGSQYNDSELRERLDRFEGELVEFESVLSMLAKGSSIVPSLPDDARPCMNLQPGAECVLSLEPRVPVGVFDGGLRIAWPDWAEWQTLTIGFAEGRGQEILRLGSGGKSLKHAGGEYAIWVVKLVDQNAKQRKLKIGIRRDK